MLHTTVKVQGVPLLEFQHAQYKDWFTVTEKPCGECFGVSTTIKTRDFEFNVPCSCP